MAAAQTSTTETAICARASRAEGRRSAKRPRESVSPRAQRPRNPARASSAAHPMPRSSPAEVPSQAATWPAPAISPAAPTATTPSPKETPMKPMTRVICEGRSPAAV
ncbi:hypothetical protein ROTAS13_04763 [Roseomonas sp. TAS13]|nr:hypothetical protein ROTAS13_04763 [Roseomonas sp. TAS13]